jgi:ATP-dependent DNA helicase RecG
MLHDELHTHVRILDPQKKALKRLKINTVYDLLYHFPARYERSGDHKTVEGLVVGTDAILFGTIRKPETRRAWKSKRPMSEAWLEDGTGRVKLMWFNQPYIAKMITDGALVKISGRVEGKDSPYIANPEIEQVSELPVGGTDTVFGADSESDELFAVYPETRGITSRWIRHTIAKLLKKELLTELEEVIPEDVLTKNKLPPIQKAIVWIHQPKKETHKDAARKRFAFEEIFIIQVAMQQQRTLLDSEPTNAIVDGKERAKEFIARFPFTLTDGQQHSIDTILADIRTPPAMSRLLEGDVGSGKTAVAATIAYTVVSTPPKDRPSAHLQVAYMAPTEILAEQHFVSFIELFGHLPIQMGLITSSGCKKYPSKVDAGKPTNISRNQLLKWVANGEIAILIGTHSLIQKTVQFRDLGLVIIDEQHRFGTGQRHTLTQKDGVFPHLLSMTATPIPRTLALTLYGDLDLTVLDDMPPGRKPIITNVVEKTKRDGMYTAVRAELDAGRQVYVICPRIDEPDPKKAMAVQTRSVKEETERLKRTEFKNYRVEMLHGQMKPKEKEDIMRAFLAHDIDVLVATSVVEVGVNVPNATVIVIEGAERFGLAQLHQLRGRVVRSNHQAYCYALTSSGNTSARLKAFTTARNGFELAERDLKIRGPGELHGRSQSGLTDLGMDALKNIKMVEIARSEAQRIVNTDPTLTHHPTLKQAVTAHTEKIHFE